AERKAQLFAAARTTGRRRGRADACARQPPLYVLIRARRSTRRCRKSCKRGTGPRAVAYPFYRAVEHRAVELGLHVERRHELPQGPREPPELPRFARGGACDSEMLPMGHTRMGWTC